MIHKVCTMSLLLFIFKYFILIVMLLNKDVSLFLHLFINRLIKSLVFFYTKLVLNYLLGV